MQVNCYAFNFEATAYSLEGCEKAPTDYGYGITASGEYVREGIIATDTTVIPMHSLVYVVGNDFDGLYEAKDIGGAVRGKRIDIYMPDNNDCIKFGLQKVKVIVLRKGKFMRTFYKFKGFEHATIPVRKTKCSAGYDFCVAEDCDIEPHSFKLVHSGIGSHLDDDEFILMSSRSSLCKKGLNWVNGVGIIDADYDGEIMMPLFNFSDKTVSLHIGDRVAQGIIIKYNNLGDVVEVSRKGGFGSTDI